MIAWTLVKHYHKEINWDSLKNSFPKDRLHDVKNKEEDKVIDWRVNCTFESVLFDFKDYESSINDFLKNPKYTE